MKKFAVAVDGPAGSGKSTVAKEIAKALGILYIDTGAMYRTVGMACLCAARWTSADYWVLWRLACSPA